MVKQQIKRLFAVAMMTFVAANINANANTVKKGRFEEDLLIKVWDNKSAPHSNNLTGEVEENSPNLLGNVTEVELLVYEADREKRTGQAVVICPGGGYRILSMMNEGKLIAQWFAKNGITAAIVTYRMPNGVKEVPYEDAVEAVRVMRQRSKQLGFDPRKVGIVGFSAGGHLAASVSALPEVDARPNFSVLFYPVITSDEGPIHSGSYNNLLGKSRTQEQSDVVSPEKHFDEMTPPAILFHCTDDKTVSPINSILYYSELYKYNKKSALYVFPKGGHGWGNKDSYEYQKVWQAQLLDWLGKLEVAE
ncbi:MAG: alpha/beta hydrolase [Rikenellaceae bacterium]